MALVALQRRNRLVSLVYDRIDLLSGFSDFLRANIGNALLIPIENALNALNALLHRHRKPLIEHPDGVLTEFAHIDTHSPAVANGFLKLTQGRSRLRHLLFDLLHHRVCLQIGGAHAGAVAQLQDALVAHGLSELAQRLALHVQRRLDLV